MVVRVYDLALREFADNPAMWIGLVLYPDKFGYGGAAVVDRATTTDEQTHNPIYVMGAPYVTYLEPRGQSIRTTTISGHFTSFADYTFVNHTLDCGWVVSLNSLRIWFYRENLL